MNCHVCVHDFYNGHELSLMEKANSVEGRRAERHKHNEKQRVEELLGPVACSCCPAPTADMQEPIHASPPKPPGGNFQKEGLLNTSHHFLSPGSVPTEMMLVPASDFGLKQLALQ